MKLPVSVQEIGSRIFRDCVKLSSVEIHTPCLDNNIFDGCQHLEEVTTDCEKYHTIERIIYNQDVTKIIFIPPATQTIVLPKTVVFAQIDEKNLKELTFWQHQKLSIESSKLQTLHMIVGKKNYMLSLNTQFLFERSRWFRHNGLGTVQK